MNRQVKRCEDCGAVIAVWPECDWYRWIRVKRCPDCARAARDAQKLESAHRRRIAKRIARSRVRTEEEANRIAEERKRVALENLALELQINALLKQDVTELGGRSDWTERCNQNGKQVDSGPEYSGTE